MNQYTIRPIAPGDNAALAKIIRDTLAEFGANHPGTVYFDPTTDFLFELFRHEKSGYWVVEDEIGLAEGAGIFPTKGLPADTCELVKLYLLPRVRSKGLGRLLMQHCHIEAIHFGYSSIYLETMPELTIAIPLYEKMGYHYLEAPLGESGHFGCAIHMIKNLF